MGAPYGLCKQEQIHYMRKRYNYSTRRRQQRRDRAHSPARQLRAAHVRQDTLRQLARERGRQGD